MTDDLQRAIEYLTRDTRTFLTMAQAVSDNEAQFQCAVEHINVLVKAAQRVQVLEEKVQSLEAEIESLYLEKAGEHV